MSLVFLFIFIACSEQHQAKSSSLVEVYDTAKNTDNAGGEATEDSNADPSYTVTTSIIGSGDIAPSEYLEVENGETLHFVIVADEGFGISQVSGTCGGTLDALTLTYTTSPIVSDCVVEVEFIEEVVFPDPYCSNIPADLVGVVVCDPAVNLDDWSVGAGFSTNSLMIPMNKILSLPFTTNAIGLEGEMTITNNMPGLNASGFHWRGWFSHVPGGEQIVGSNTCSRYSPNPNPYSAPWNQTVSGGYDCHLGTTIQTMYFNMEVRCYEFLSSNCTPGEFYSGDYYIGLFNDIDN